MENNESLEDEELKRIVEGTILNLKKRAVKPQMKPMKITSEAKGSYERFLLQPYSQFSNIKPLPSRNPHMMTRIPTKPN